MYQAYEVHKQFRRTFAESIAKPLRMNAGDPVQYGDATRLEIARLVVFGGEERRHIGLLRKSEGPLCAHIGPIDSVFHRRETGRMGGQRWTTQGGADYGASSQYHV